MRMRPEWVERAALVGLLAATLGVRSVSLDQIIVENDVGRQVPTAMVARNLDRGASFWRPELDTGPFPNLFLVEPPVYQAVVVGLNRAVGLGLTQSGRFVSAVGLTLAALAVYLLVRPRSGPMAALLAVLAIGSFPVTIRYGRAFQPDALMIGCAAAGLACWDRAQRAGARGWLIPAWFYLAAGCALKVTAGAMVLPVALAIAWERQPASWRTNGARAALLATVLAPAILWYVHAAHVMATTPAGSSAARDSGAIWLSALSASSWLDPTLLATVARSLVVRAFGPVGFLIAAAGVLLVRKDASARLAMLWLSCVLFGFAVLGAKMHHEYYWLAAAPAVAMLAGAALAEGASSGPREVRWAALAMVIAMPVAGALQAADTFRAPASWDGFQRLVDAIRGVVPEAFKGGDVLIAREAVLFESGRRGFRLETGERAARRAAGEWGVTLQTTDDPLALIEAYRSRGAQYLADVCNADETANDHRLHEAARSRYTEVMRDPGLVLVRLDGWAGALAPTTSARDPGWPPPRPDPNLSPGPRPRPRSDR